MTYRKTPQPMLPRVKPSLPKNAPNIYPTYPIATGSIQQGYNALAKNLMSHSLVLIDGYGGTLWDNLRESLEQVGISANWIFTHDLMKSEDEINALVEPFLGGDDPIFGTRFTGTLGDFFDPDKLSGVDVSQSPTIVYGEGAFLVADKGYRVYVDLPKNEIQYRSRADSITTLGASQPDTPKKEYKRFYFVDWIALNKHKAEFVAQVDLFVDGQDVDTPTMLNGDDARATFEKMVHTVFRVRPWFEPGAWGGQWMKAHIPQLAEDVPNYAWSFEMIAPEQGIILENADHLMELSYDWLQYYDNVAVLGDYADNFGYEFPIRYDFLDTIEGGNLSLQCHPNPDFIRSNFGEHFTQDETYYIFEDDGTAEVYLGFQDDVDPDKLRSALENSVSDGVELPVTDFVQVHPAKKGDLFLIPHGTVHCSGTGSVVLEISATPYIFTFKMYDWLRVGLDGKPRPINIERAYENLKFEHSGEYVQEKLLSKPTVIESGKDWQVEHLPTHKDHFYDIHRLTFNSSLKRDTDNSAQVMMVTEGQGVTIEVEGLDEPMYFNYAETFIIPAAAGKFTLYAVGDAPVVIMQSFLRRDWFEKEENQWLKIEK